MASFMLCRALTLLAKAKKERSMKINKRICGSPLASKRNIKLLCKICFNQNGIASLFDNTDRPTIIEDIFSFTGVKIKPSRKRTKVICQNCLDLLDGCIKFRNMCKTRHKKMKQIRQSTNSFIYSEPKPINEEIQDLDYDPDLGDILTNQDDDKTNHSNMPSPQCNGDSYKKKWGCNCCSQHFEDWEQYNTHLPCEPPKKDKKQASLCDVCGKVFTSAQILSAHKATHTDVFAYKCAKCPYESRYRAYLVIHMRSHMEKSERPYKCALCPSTAITASNLANHVRRLHTTERPYKCASCEKTFRCKSDLTHHTRLVHLRKMTVECSICYKTFNSKKYLKSHNWKVHKLKPEKSNLPNKLPSYIQHRANLEENSANHINSSHINREESNFNMAPLV